MKKRIAVINTTAAQISLDPRTKADTDNLRIVEYDLIDGIMIIRCD